MLSGLARKGDVGGRVLSYSVLHRFFAIRRSLHSGEPNGGITITLLFDTDDDAAPIASVAHRKDRPNDPDSERWVGPNSGRLVL
jgi:hypothetical protein